MSRRRGLVVGVAVGLFVIAGGLALQSRLVGVPLLNGVPLLTGVPPMVGGGGCFTNSAMGLLVVDAAAGTAIIDEDVRASVPMRVMWRPGFSARRVGSEVEVLDQGGSVVATTGRRYRIDGGYVDGAFWACDRVVPQP